jgi:hypothetical protein
MTSVLQPISFDLRTAASDLKSFKAWFAAAGFIGEQAIVAQIKSRPQMACLLATTLGLSAPNLIKFEMQVKGMFRTDLVLGNDGLRQFGLIEFEDAMSNSIFKTGTKQYRYWSPRIEHGFSQIIDWAWVRSDHPNDTVLKAAFGGPVTVSAYAVICGRKASLNGDTEEKRFAHRRAALKVEGISAMVLTYDEMVLQMEDNLSALSSFI